MLYFWALIYLRKRGENTNPSAQLVSAGISSGVTQMIVQ
jgi:hypothetical protein